MSDKADDQTDVIQANEQMRAELETLRAGAKTSTASIESLQADLAAAKLSLEETNKGNTTLLATLSERTKERDALKAENTDLATKMVDFDKRVVTELRKHGINPKAMAAEKPSDDKALTATEKVLQAQGVSSLAELSAKHAKP